MLLFGLLIYTVAAVPLGRHLRPRRCRPRSRAAGELGRRRQRVAAPVGRRRSAPCAGSIEAARRLHADPGAGARQWQNQDGALVDLCAR